MPSVTAASASSSVGAACVTLTVSACSRLDAFTNARALTKACRRSSSARRAGTAALANAALLRLTHSTKASNVSHDVLSGAAFAETAARGAARSGAGDATADASALLRPLGARMLSQSACTSCAPMVCVLCSRQRRVLRRGGRHGVCR